MASIQKRTRKRPDGSTYTRHIVRWRDPDGAPRSETFQTKPAATAFLARLELADATGQPLEEKKPAPVLTFAAWSEQWLDIVAARTATGALAPKSAAGYETRVRVHLVPRLGDRPLRALTVGDVEDTLTDMQATGSAPATAAAVRRTLSKMLTDAQKRELVDRNVAALADAPAIATRTPSTFTADEMARIIAVLPTHRLGRMFLFAALTGLRASELRGLRWENVDLDVGTYTVVKGVHRLGPAAGRVAPVGLVESNPKTEGSGNSTPMSPAAVDVLREHRSAQLLERIAAPVWSDRGYVFSNVIGGALEPGNVLRIWKKLLKDAGVAYRPDTTRPGRGLHELRRTFATALRTAGIPVEDTARLGRWSSTQVLLASYAGTSDARLRAAAQAAADALVGT